MRRQVWYVHWADLVLLLRSVYLGELSDFLPYHLLCIAN